MGRDSWRSQRVKRSVDLELQCFFGTASSVALRGGFLLTQVRDVRTSSEVKLGSMCVCVCGVVLYLALLIRPPSDSG